jgi:hypothetical protein
LSVMGRLVPSQSVLDEGRSRITGRRK